MTAQAIVVIACAVLVLGSASIEDFLLDERM